MVGFELLKKKMYERNVLKVVVKHEWPWPLSICMEFYVGYTVLTLMMASFLINIYSLHTHKYMYRWFSYMCNLNKKPQSPPTSSAIACLPLFGKRKWDRDRTKSLWCRAIITPINSEWIIWSGFILHKNTSHRSWFLTRNVFTCVTSWNVNLN